MQRVRLSDPRLSAGPVRILGHPWTLESCDTPNPDSPEFAYWKLWETNTVRIANWVPESVQACHAWDAIWHTLYAQLVYGDGQPNGEKATDAIARATWAAVRENAGAIAAWFGWTSGSPKVEEGTLTVLGLPTRLLRPHRIPGRGADVFGLSEMKNATIYVRGDLCPHRAASIGIHELQHAVIQQISPAGDAEAFVGPMEAGLATLFFDNPEAMMTLFGIRVEHTAE